jgi:hypothetical protein
MTAATTIARDGSKITCRHSDHYGSDGLPLCRDDCHGQTVACGRGLVRCERHATSGELLDREELTGEQVCRAIALQFAAAALGNSDAVDLVNLATWIVDGMDPWGDAVRYRPEPEIRPAADDELAVSEHSRGLHRGDHLEPRCPVCVPAHDRGDHSACVDRNKCDEVLT